MYKYQNLLPTYLFTKKSSQTLILFFSMIGAMGLNFISSVVTSKSLGPESFGDYTFVRTVWNLLALVTTLGFLQSGSRVLLLEIDYKNKRQIIGCILIISLIMGLVSCLLSSIFSFFVDNIFSTHVHQYLFFLSPFVFSLLLQAALLLILQSTNQIFLLSFLYLVPAFFYLVEVIIFNKVFGLTIYWSLSLQHGTLLLVCIFLFLFLKPDYLNIKININKIKSINGEFGFPIFSGSLANVATGYINRLAISYWVNNTAIGYFSLASSFTEPLKFIPNATATSAYKDFSEQKRISVKMVFYTLIASIGTLILAWFCFGAPLSFIYKENFQEVGPMSRIISIGAISWGFGDFFNRFLGSHGKGKELRNAAYAVGLVNILGIIALTPNFGVNGAVITTLIAGFAYLFFMLFEYWKNTRNTE